MNRPRGRAHGGRRGRDDGGPRRTGLVLAVSVRHAKVRLDDGETLRCEYSRGLYDPTSSFTRPVAAGDRVELVSDRGRPLVDRVLPRRGYLSRLRGRKEQVIVANVDQVIIVSAAAEPRFRPRLIDRLIVAAERARFAPVVVINKIDRAEDRAPFLEKIALYRGLGYAAIVASAATGEGVDELREILRGKISAAAGPSGVGKSTLLNSVQPGLVIRTAPISDRWGKGVHTTTGVTLHPLQVGGYYADTPGVRAFAIAGLPSADVAVLFREFQPFIDSCRFNSCTHDHEPECAVQIAVLHGKISFERYESYLKIIRGDEEPAEDGEVDDDDEADGPDAPAAEDASDAPDDAAEATEADDADEPDEPDAPGRATP